MEDYNNFVVIFDDEFEKLYSDDLSCLSISHYLEKLFLIILNHYIEIKLEDLSNQNQINAIHINYLFHYFEFQTFHSIQYETYSSDVYNLKIVKKVIKHYYNIVVDKLNEYHFNTILSEFTRINAIDVPEQRTPEWFEQRLKLISASEAYKAINIKAPSGYKNLILSKLGYSGPRPRGVAINHGVVFEIASQMMYEFRNGITIKEYGCLPHSDYVFIGASPDGIVSSAKKESNLISRMKIGRMLEIKNPSSRSIIILNDYNQAEYRRIIPTGYYYQIQLQLEVCNLQYCDFLETKITYYDSFDEFKEDNYILSELTIPHNKYIPITNLNSEGMEKGLIIKIIDYSQSDTKISSILFPLDGDYTIEAFTKWIDEEKEIYKQKISSDSFEFEPIYWKCDVYEVKTVEKDQTFINDKIISGLQSCWNEIESDRTLTSSELLLKYKDFLEYESDTEDQQPRKIRRIIKNKNKVEKVKMIFTDDD